jgi:hypothetical protein
VALVLAACGGGKAAERTTRSGPPPVYSPISGRVVTSPDQRVLGHQGGEHRSGAPAGWTVRRQTWCLLRKLKAASVDSPRCFLRNDRRQSVLICSARITDPNVGCPIRQSRLRVFRSTSTDGASARGGEFGGRSRNDVTTRGHDQPCVVPRTISTDIRQHCLTKRATACLLPATWVGPSMNQVCPVARRLVTLSEAAYPAEAMHITWDSASKTLVR